MTRIRKNPSHVAIVGGGMLGLTMAYELAKAGRKVTVFEAGSDVGGLAGSARFGDYEWDRFYHVVLLSDLNTRGLLDELGVSHRLRFGPSRTGFYTDRKLYSMSNALEFLRFPPLKLIDKLRLGMTIWMASRIRHPERLEKMLAIDWLTRWSGKRVVEKIWAPLLKSKLGENYTVASAAFIWAIIARLYAARRSGLKEERFGVIDGGYSVVFRVLVKRLTEMGVTIHTGTPIRAVRPTRAGAGVITNTGEAHHFDEVVLTVAPKLAASICPGLAPAEADRLSNVPYQGVICATLLLRKPLSPYYVVNLTDGNLPFTGVIEMTALTGPQQFGGHSLVYLPMYLAQDAPEWSLSAAQIRDQFLHGLDMMYPDFDRHQVVDLKISKSRQVLPISTLNYSEQVMPPVKTSMQHVRFINAAQIPYGTLNVNETIGLVKANLGSLLADTRGLSRTRDSGRRAAGQPVEKKAASLSADAKKSVPEAV